VFLFLLYVSMRLNHTFPFLIPTPHSSPPSAAPPPPPPPPPRQGEFGMSDPLRLPQRLELEIDPDLYERIEELSVRSGRSVP